MKKLTKKNSIIFILCVLLIGLIIWTIWGSTALEVNEYEITNSRIPQGFSGFRITQVSDLHSRGAGNSIIPERFNNRPEIIAVELESK